MPEKNLKRLGQQLRAARNDARLTQEQLSTLSHVSTKHIANIEKGKMNPSFEILLALSKVLKLSLDSLVFPNISEEDVACKQLAISYKSCRPAMRKTMLNSTRTLANELAALEQHIEK